MTMKGNQLLYFVLALEHKVVNSWNSVLVENEVLLAEIADLTEVGTHTDKRQLQDESEFFLGKLRCSLSASSRVYWREKEVLRG